MDAEEEMEEMEGEEEQEVVGERRGFHCLQCLAKEILVIVRG